MTHHILMKFYTVLCLIAVICCEGDSVSLKQVVAVHSFVLPSDN